MKHNLAIVGVGGMGSWHYECICKNVDNIIVKGFFDFLPEDSLGRIKEKGIENAFVYKSFQDILDDEEIDIVTIATPNDFHKQLAIDALRAGKNVVCEKPVTLNSGELEEIIAVQKETGKLFMVHQNRRWDRDYRIVKDILKNNLIGNPYFIDSRVQGSRGVMHAWRGFKRNGGGMLLDWGVHMIDQMMMLIDSPVVLVDAHLFSVFAAEVDDNIKLFIRFQNGVSAMIEIVTNCFIHQPRWHISGDNGTAVIEDWSCKGKILRKKQDSEMIWEDVIVYTDAGPTRTMSSRPAGTQEELPLPYQESYESMPVYYKNVTDVIEGKAEPAIKLEESLRVMKVIDALFLSQKEGRAINCNI